jgi:hypothetical protein
MSLHGTADAEQLADLTKLLDGYADDIGIGDDDAARDRLAAHIMALFNTGLPKPEDIRRKLDSSSHGRIEQPAA